MYPQEAANIADAINGARLGADTDDKIAGVRAAAEAVADSIADDNMDFDRDAWLIACGFAPPAIPAEHVSFMPEPYEVLRTEGNAYAADGMTLMVAPLRTDGSIDHTQWAEYMPSGETERFWAVRMVQAIIAMRF